MFLLSQGALGWLYQCALGSTSSGYLAPDFMAGVDQVTAWNVFSVTPQSLPHLTNGDVEEGI